MSVERQLGRILIVEAGGFIRSKLRASLINQGVDRDDIHEASDLLAAMNAINQEQFAIILVDDNLDPEDRYNTDGKILAKDIPGSTNNFDSYIIDISSSKPNSDQGIPNAHEELRVKYWEESFDDAAARIIQIRNLRSVRNPNGS